MLRLVLFRVGAELRGRRARAVVRERFGIDTMAASLCDVYSQVASGQLGGTDAMATAP